MDPSHFGSRVYKNRRAQLIGRAPSAVTRVAASDWTSPRVSRAPTPKVESPSPQSDSPPLTHTRTPTHLAFFQARAATHLQFLTMGLFVPLLHRERDTFASEGGGVNSMGRSCMNYPRCKRNATKHKLECAWCAEGRQHDPSYKPGQQHGPKCVNGDGRTMAYGGGGRCGNCKRHHNDPSYKAQPKGTRVSRVGSPDWVSRLRRLILFRCWGSVPTFVGAADGLPRQE